MRCPRGGCRLRPVPLRLAPRLAPKPWQAKLAPSGTLAASAAYKRELEKRLQAFDRAVWVRLLCDAGNTGALTLPRQGVHNSGPMPGEDEDDLWVDSTQDDAPPNVKCPLTGKAVLELEEPLRCVPFEPRRLRRRACSCVCALYYAGTSWATCTRRRR